MRCGLKEKQMTQTNHRASSSTEPSRRLREPRDAQQGLNLDGRRATGIAVPAAHEHVDHRDSTAAECGASGATAKIFRQGRRRAGCSPSPTYKSTAAAAAATAISTATSNTATTNSPTTAGVGRLYYPNKEDIGPIIRDRHRGRPRRGPRGSVRPGPRKRQPAASRPPPVSGECQSHPR